MVIEERDILDICKDKPSIVDAFEWLSTNGLLDVRGCQRVCIRRYYNSLIKAGTKSMEAQQRCAERYCVSDSVVQHALYGRR